MNETARQQRRRKRRSQAEGDPRVLSLLAWRQSCFEDILRPHVPGPKLVKMARRLADSDADYHAAARMMDRGCTPELLVEILA